MVGVGDVCSFAQMDVRKHGNPDWHAERDVESMQDTPPEVAKSPMHPFVRWEVFLLVSWCEAGGFDRSPTNRNTFLRTNACIAAETL